VSANRQYTVSFDRAFPEDESRHRQALASLPVSFRVVEQDHVRHQIDAVVVSGGAVGWSETARLNVDAGVRAVMVARPEGYDSSVAKAFLSALSTHGAIVAVECVLASSLVYGDELATLRRDVQTALVVDCFSVVERMARDSEALMAGTVVQQLALVRSLGLDPAMRLVERSETNYVIADDRREAPVLLSGVLVDEGEGGYFRLDVVARSARWRVRFDSGNSARPPALTRLTESGAVSARQHFEHPIRSLWRELHIALDQNQPMAYTAADLFLDLEIVDHVLRR
jgi:hypothetical protein